MKIYISGKIAGDPDYKGKFARAAAHSASCWCWSIRTRWMHASSAGVRDARMNTDMSRETVLNACARRTGIQRKA